MHVMGIPEKAEGSDLRGFVLDVLTEQLVLDVNAGFEIAQR